MSDALQYVFMVWDLDRQEYAEGIRYKQAPKKIWLTIGAARNAISQGSIRHVKNYEIHPFQLTHLSCLNIVKR